MRFLRPAQRIGSIAICAALGCCATQPKGPPPIVDLVGRTCTPTPDLSQAITLTLPDAQSSKGASALVTIDGGTACLQPAGEQSSLYVVFRLPDSGTEYLISIESLVLENGVFAPRATFLNTAGVALRELPRDAFVFRGMVLSVQARSHANERYLLLRSDPAPIGRRFAQTNVDVRANYSAMGITMYQGEDRTHQYTYTHSGIVRVSVGAVPDTQAH